MSTKRLELWTLKKHELKAALEREAQLLNEVSQELHPAWTVAMWDENTPSNRFVACIWCGCWSSALDVYDPCFNAHEATVA